MIVISRNVSIPDSELEITAIRAQGAGGQHVNKTSTAIHLRFDIRASGLPEYYKERLLAASHHLISSDGVIIIKAQEYRSRGAKSGSGNLPTGGGDKRINRGAKKADRQHVLRAPRKSAGCHRRRKIHSESTAWESSSNARLTSGNKNYKEFIVKTAILSVVAACTLFFLDRL